MDHLQNALPGITEVLTARSFLDIRLLEPGAAFRTLTLLSTHCW